MYVQTLILLFIALEKFTWSLRRFICDVKYTWFLRLVLTSLVCDMFASPMRLSNVFSDVCSLRSLPITDLTITSSCLVVYIKNYYNSFSFSTLLSTRKPKLSFPAFYIINGLLLLLCVLHLIWSYMILNVLHRTVKAGCLTRDDRSSSEDSED